MKPIGLPHLHCVPRVPELTITGELPAYTAQLYTVARCCSNSNRSHGTIRR